MVISSALTHGESKRATLIDQDVVDFYTTLKASNHHNNTIVIFFGDHGNRASEFRASIQGKLEERLPMMSFSFPTLFRQKYPTYFKNFVKNSRLMTTHYDIHTTLKHLIQFPDDYPASKHPYGRTIFSDIGKYNRIVKLPV